MTGAVILYMLPQLFFFSFGLFFTNVFCSSSSAATAVGVAPFVPEQKYQFNHVTVCLSIIEIDAPVPEGYMILSESVQLFSHLSFQNSDFSHFTPIMQSMISKDIEPTKSIIISFSIYGVDIRRMPLSDIQKLSLSVDFDREGPIIPCPRPMSPELLKKVSDALAFSSSPYVNYYTLSAIQGNLNSIKGVRRTISQMNLGGESCKDIFGNDIGAINLRIINNNIPECLVLIAAQKNLQKQNDYGRLPIHIASISGNAMIVELLIFLGSDPSIKDGGVHGCSPLHYAAFHGKLEVVELLIKEGSIWDLKDLSGNTPMDLAKQKNHHDILKIFNDLSLAQQSIDNID